MTSSAIQVQIEQLPAAELQSFHVTHLLKDHLQPQRKKHSYSGLKTISNSWKSLCETSVFWNNLFIAGPCSLSWDIIPQIHSKPEAEAVYKDSTTIICTKLSSQLSTSQLNGWQGKSSQLLPSSSHLLQLGVSTWKQALSEADTPYGGTHFQSQSKGLPTAPPNLLLLGKTIPKWSYSLSWYKQSPNKSVFLLSFWHSPLPWSKQLPPYSGPQSFCLLHKPDQPSFSFLVSFSFSYICLPDLKSSVCLLCCWETS